MAISERQCLGLLRPHLITMWDAASTAHKRLLSYADYPLFERRTIATVENNLIFSELIGRFDQIPGIKVVNEAKKNLRFIGINDKALLWVKKVDSERHTTNYPTDNAEDMLTGQFSLPGMDDLSLVVLGYRLNPEETQIQRLSFHPPFKKRPEWFFDVEIAPPREMKNPSPMRIDQPKLKLQIIRGARQKELL